MRDGGGRFHRPATRCGFLGQRDVLRLLLSCGADADAANATGWTPLHHACLHGHTEVSEALISAGASMEARNRFGAKPLGVATAGGHLSTVK